jgi:hypothetical protein
MAEKPAQPGPPKVHPAEKARGGEIYKREGYCFEEGLFDDILAAAVMLASRTQNCDCQEQDLRHYVVRKGAISLRSRCAVRRSHGSL